MKARNTKCGIVGAVIGLSVWTVWADLQAIVTPGYQFSSTERPSTSTLNRLGTPTIQITGTLGGTNAGLAAGSVSGNMLASSVADNLTLDFTNSSPQALRIKAEGVKPRELSTLVAGAGLAGGGGAALSISNDTVTIVITNDVLTLTDNLSVHHLNCTNNYTFVGGTDTRGTNVSLLDFERRVATNATFTTIELSIGLGSIADTAHNLGVTPQFVRGVLVCKTADLGYAPGDEVSAEKFTSDDGTFSFVYGANSTNVFVTGGTTAVGTRNRSTGAAATITNSRWRLKIYARP